MTTINETGMPRAMLINDLSCIGKCSLSVALPIVSACGVEAVALPTVILSTHTGGFEGDDRGDAHLRRALEEHRREI